jgi:hypothetical protein
MTPNPATSHQNKKSDLQKSGLIFNRFPLTLVAFDIPNLPRQHSARRRHDVEKETPRPRRP